MRRDEEGFTLIEVLIAISLLGIVLGVVATAFMVTINSSGDATNEVLDSQAVGFTSSFLTTDAASATSISKSAPDCPGAGGSLILALTWTDLAESVTVNYRLDSASGSFQRLMWRGSGACAGTSTAVELSSGVKSAAATPLASPNGVSLTLTGQLGATQTIKAYRRVP
jgi:prepilin-type N-terminal cleavage/methylation domain-containing protein